MTNVSDHFESEVTWRHTERTEEKLERCRPEMREAMQMALEATAMLIANTLHTEGEGAAGYMCTLLIEAAIDASKPDAVDLIDSILEPRVFGEERELLIPMEHPGPWYVDDPIVFKTPLPEHPDHVRPGLPSFFRLSGRILPPLPRHEVDLFNWDKSEVETGETAKDKPMPFDEDI